MNYREKIEKAIEFLADKIKNNVSADEALKYTQAALNLANVNKALTPNNQ